MYVTIPNTQEKKKVEQGYNYLDGLILSIAEFFQTRIENLGKSIPLSFPSRNRKKHEKGFKKRKTVIFDNSEDEDLNRKIEKGKRTEELRAFEKMENERF